MRNAPKGRTPEFPLAVKSGSAVVKVYRVRHRHAASGLAYIVAWYVSGKRLTRQFTDRDRALKEARLKANQLAAGEVSAATITGHDADDLHLARDIAGDVPLLSALHEWRKARDLVGTSLIAVCEAWAARNPDAADSITGAEAADLFMAAKRKQGVDTTCSYEKTIPHFREAFGQVKVTSITVQMLQRWMNDRFPHPVTRNTVRKRIVTLFRWLRKQGYIPRDMETEAERTDSAREEPTEIGIFSATDFRQILALIQAKHPDYIGTVVLSGFCGLRRTEVHAQAWADVDLDQGHLRVTKAKINTPAMRLVKLCDEAVEWLKLCPNREGLVSPPLGVDRIRAFIRRTGIETPDNGFRHGYISHLVAKTGDVPSTALEAGNSPQKIFQHYRALVTKAEGEAWFSVRPTTPRKRTAK